MRALFFLCLSIMKRSKEKEHKVIDGKWDSRLGGKVHSRHSVFGPFLCDGGMNGLREREGSMVHGWNLG